MWLPLLVQNLWLVLRAATCLLLLPNSMNPLGNPDQVRQVRIYVFFLFTFCFNFQNIHRAESSSRHVVTLYSQLIIVSAAVAPVIGPETPAVPSVAPPADFAQMTACIRLAMQVALTGGTPDAEKRALDAESNKELFRFAYLNYYINYRSLQQSEHFDYLLMRTVDLQVRRAEGLAGVQVLSGEAARVPAEGHRQEHRRAAICNRQRERECGKWVAVEPSAVNGSRGRQGDHGEARAGVHDAAACASSLLIILQLIVLQLTGTMPPVCFTLPVAFGICALALLCAEHLAALLPKVDLDSEEYARRVLGRIGTLTEEEKRQVREQHEVRSTLSASVLLKATV